MKRLLRTAEPDAVEVHDALRVVTAFDELQRTTPETAALAGLASQITGRRVIIDDKLTGRTVDTGMAPFDASEDLVRAFSRIDLQGFQIADEELGDNSFLAVGLEHAEGRLGTVALVDRSPVEWTLRDELVLERLSQTVAIQLTQAAKPSVAHDPRDSLEKLLTQQPDAHDGSLLASAARLDTSKTYRVLVVHEFPTKSASPQVLLSVIDDARTDEAGPHECVIGRQVVSVVQASIADQWAEAVHLTASQGRRIILRIGAGAPHSPLELSKSFAQARESLQLGSSQMPTVWYESLGALALLSHLPSHLVHEQPDVTEFRTLQERGTIVDLDVAIVENYCESDSLRQTAERVHMHHSSVDYRLKQIERLVGFTLRTQEGKIRALLAIRLARLNQYEQSEPGDAPNSV